jgi:hypothetical protein
MSGSTHDRVIEDGIPLTSLIVIDANLVCFFLHVTADVSADERFLAECDPFNFRQCTPSKSMRMMGHRQLFNLKLNRVAGFLAYFKQLVV